MILALAGFKQSGKDTVAAYLVKQYGFERRAFADPLKRSVAALFDIPFSEVDKLKMNTDIGLAIGRQTQDSSIQPYYRPMTFREVLQRYGTESHRGIFGEDFWVDQTLPMSPARYLGRKIVITDCRFSNEGQRIHALGGIIWEVRRQPPGSSTAPAQGSLDIEPHSNFGEPTEPHPSEVIDFPTDCILHNDGTLDELYGSIETLLNATAKTLFAQPVTPIAP